ncbi:DNA-3-methyladenine glycosylase [Streptomyces sp. A7024]|uniref:Putative 3-methyladenine DNA glycosylase n=1 Tax=Streptomyces coryli TaxID=1128680 RepID=A0A6G4U8J8_9ACTN|nr:DNA-3-methyladenine glycosylase [Streptomyces coryli]NGN68050.1 DNA-3-methyladenine glycosylase [Streptomyces coryli]
MPRTPLSREFFQRPVLEVAPDLLGRTLLRTTDEGTLEVRLTEVEAYEGANDPGSHAYRGKTRRNEVMFGPAGHIYVYFTYGMWHCMNVVCGDEGKAGAVLLRAGEIVRGAELARKRRPAARHDRELAQGPARLATALDVDLALNGADACAPESPLELLAGEPPPKDSVRNGPRTGVGGEGAWHPYRYWIEGDRTVSRYRAHGT